MESLIDHRLPAETKRPGLRTIVSWDLMVAFFVGGVAGLVWWLSESKAQVAWVVIGITLSLALAGLAWTQWNQLKGSLRGTEYGELLRLVDPNEDDIRRPYTIVTYVSLASAAWATVTGFALNTFSPGWESVFIGVGIFLLTWAALGVVSLKVISNQNDRLIAQLESLREETAAAEREHLRDRKTTSGGAEPD